MALPTLVKTWIFDLNNTVSVGGPFAGYGELMFQWKTFMLTGSWVVVSSSDASTADNTDRWIDAAACNTHDNPGLAHSWIVLQNDVISTGFQLLVNLRESGGGTDVISEMYFSEAVGFTGGTTTNRPTAADEVDASDIAGRYDWTNSKDLTVEPAQLHMARSSDGEITRWWIYVGGAVTCFVSIEKPVQTVSGWTIPWVCLATINDAVTKFNPSYARLNDAKTNISSRANGVKTNLYLTSEGAISSMLGQLQASGADLDGGAFPFFPPGLFSDTAGSRGRLGVLTDLWWGSTFPGEGDHYPGDASRQFVQISDIIIPWPGGGFAAMLTT